MKRVWEDIIVDHDNVDILDWIHSHFENDNWHKQFEITVSLRETDYDEDGNVFYVKEEENNG